MEKNTKPVTDDSVGFIELTDAEMETTTGGGIGVARESLVLFLDYKKGNSSRQELGGWYQSLSPGKQNQVVNAFNIAKSTYFTS